MEMNVKWNAKSRKKSQYIYVIVEKNIRYRKVYGTQKKCSNIIITNVNCIQEN